MTDEQLFSFADIPARATGRQPRSRPDAVEEVRAMGTWTLDKLHVLELYLKVYRRVAGSGTYLDAFAGEGRIKVDEEERAGSASVALSAGAFRHLYFMEKNPTLNTRLATHLTDTFSERLVSKCEVLPPGDANQQVPELLSSGRIDPARPVFALLDQDSTQLDWATVETLASFKTHTETGQCKVELWILFNTHQVMQRLWPSGRRQPNPFAAVLDRVCGGRDAWTDLYGDHRKTAKHLMIRYAERLCTQLGYRFVDHQTIVDRDGRAQYHMIHASDHPAAVEFMIWARRASEKEKLHALAVELPFPANP